MIVRTLYLIIALVGLGLPVTVIHAQAMPGEDWRADIRDYAQGLTESGRVPGLGIAVVVDDQIAYSNAFGVADAHTGTPVDEGTRFYIASSTKAITATAVTQLADQGAIDLKAPITKYLPDVAFNEGIAADSITIHDLLTMTEGVNDHLPVIFRTAYSGDYNIDLLIDLLGEYGADESGRDFDYSNLPYNLLGLVLDAVDDGRLEPGGWKRVVANTVLDPLGMTETTARVSTLEVDRIAMPHALRATGEFERIRLAKDDSNLHAAGGHFTSARSLARFVAAHIGDGTVDGRRIFSRAMIENTHREHTAQERTFGAYVRDGWGYGWDRATWGEHRILQRLGGFAGYYSHMSFMPEHDIGVVVLSNGVASSPVAEVVAHYIYDRLFGRENLAATYEERFDEISAADEAYAERIGSALAERRERLQPLQYELSDYAGTYHNAEMGRMQWRVVAGGLEVTMGVAHSRAEIFQAADNQFRITLTGGGSVAEFSFSEDGGPAEQVNWNDFEFTRAGP